MVIQDTWNHYIKLVHSVQGIKTDCKHTQKKDNKLVNWQVSIDQIE